MLHGLGGIGKTQLAVDFARRHHQAFSAVFWLDGRSEDRLRQSLAACASRIPEGQLPEKSANQASESKDDLDEKVANVLSWLERPDNNSWLLLFDNVDLDHEQGNAGAHDIRRYLPGDHGSALITSRLAKLAQLGDSKRLAKVGSDLSRAIFHKWYGKDIAVDEAGINELLGLLDGLPLALAQAASYVRESGLDIASYVRLYRQEG